MSYLDNILEQPQILRSLTQSYKESPDWQRLRQEWSQRRDSHRLVLTGLGASFNALYPDRYYLHQQGIAALHLDTGELIHYLPELLQHPLLLVVVSQSGESIEIQRLLEQIAQSGTRDRIWLVSVTNQPGNRLAQHSDLAFYTQAGTEVGVATKTYTSTLALLHWLARSLIGTLHIQDYLDILQAANQGEQVCQDWTSWQQPVFEAVQSATSFALVARGPSIASACNGALVLQEAARRPAAGYVGSQFRHGPMEVISPQLATLLFTLPGQTLDLSQRMAQDVAARGGIVVTIGAAVPDLNCPHIPLPPMDEWLSPIVDIMVVQLLVSQLASASGIVPGQFRWSGKVIQQE